MPPAYPREFRDEPIADVEYLFMQLGVVEPIVSDRQNCGNLLAGVGPFAVERGLVDAEGDDVSVRIHMRNTASIAKATFPVCDGLPVYSGGTAISGVPGTGAEIRLGGSCGSLLPTGKVVDQIDGVACTLIDNGIPVVVMRADAVGVTGHERCAVLEANEDLRAALESIRLKAARPPWSGQASFAPLASSWTAPSSRGSTDR